MDHIEKYNEMINLCRHRGEAEHPKHSRHYSSAIQKIVETIDFCEYGSNDTESDRYELCILKKPIQINAIPWKKGFTFNLLGKLDIMQLKTGSDIKTLDQKKHVYLCMQLLPVLNMLYPCFFWVNEDGRVSDDNEICRYCAQYVICLPRNVNSIY